MPLAAVVSDRFWFSIDVYERRGSRLVKTSTVKPFQTTLDEANGIFDRVVKEHPTATVNGHVWDGTGKRWLKWR